jgi:hypothetical protein
MAATSLDDVIIELDGVIARARNERSRMGYFAILYRNVTLRVRDGIAAGRFEDGARMERLDVNFANRYLDAQARYSRGEPTSRCWVAAFEATKRFRPLVLQHLLLGMNAHINFDLGAAAAYTCPGAAIADLRRDFNEINILLGEMIDDVQESLSAISPWMWILDRVGGRTDEEICTFCMNGSRDTAWGWAERLAPMEPSRIERELRELDTKVERLARAIRNPGALITCAMLPIRLMEVWDMERVMDALE